jgi:hypothetical protein
LRPGPWDILDVLVRELEGLAVSYEAAIEGADGPVDAAWRLAAGDIRWALARAHGVSDSEPAACTIPDDGVPCGYPEGPRPVHAPAAYEEAHRP